MNENEEIRVMSIMAHQDDFEFSASGTFASLREYYGERVKFKILTTTRGASGHHISGLEETFRRRDAEARKSAEIINAEYECLTCLDGAHPHGQVFIDQNTLGGLWNVVREFQPHYIFCPPVIENPLAGIHIDHYNTACAVRMIAYQLTVPHAYPVINEASSTERGVYPVIVNVDDAYARECGFHLCVDIDDVYEKKKLKMAMCHESQIFEWLPWNGERAIPTKDEFVQAFRKRHSDINKRYGLNDDTPREFFRITFWGKYPTKDDIDMLFSKCGISKAGVEFMDSL